MKKLIALIASISLLGSTLIYAKKVEQNKTLKYLMFNFDENYNTGITAKYTKNESTGTITWYSTTAQNEKPFNIEVDDNQTFYFDGEYYFFLKNDTSAIYATKISVYCFMSPIAQKSYIGEKSAFLISNDIQKDQKDITWKTKPEAQIVIDDTIKTLVSQEKIDTMISILKGFDKQYGIVRQLRFFLGNNGIPTFSFEVDNYPIRALDDADLSKKVEKIFNTKVTLICPRHSNSHHLDVFVEDIANIKVAGSIKEVKEINKDYITCFKETNAPRILKYVDWNFDQDNNGNAVCFYDETEKNVTWNTRFELNTAEYKVGKTFNYGDTIFFCVQIDEKYIYAVNISKEQFCEKLESTSIIEGTSAIIVKEDFNKQQITWTDKNKQPIPNVKIDDTIKKLIIEKQNDITNVLKKLDETYGLVYQIKFFEGEPNTSYKVAKNYELIRLLNNKQKKIADTFNTQIIALYPDKSFSRRLHVRVKTKPVYTEFVAIAKNDPVFSELNSYITGGKELKEGIEPKKPQNILIYALTLHFDDKNKIDVLCDFDKTLNTVGWKKIDTKKTEIPIAKDNTFSLENLDYYFLEKTDNIIHAIKIDKSGLDQSIHEKPTFDITNNEAFLPGNSMPENSQGFNNLTWENKQNTDFNIASTIEILLNKKVVNDIVEILKKWDKEKGVVYRLDFFTMKDDKPATEASTYEYLRTTDYIEKALKEKYNPLQICKSKNFSRYFYVLVNTIPSGINYKNANESSNYYSNYKECIKTYNAFKLKYVIGYFDSSSNINIDSNYDENSNTVIWKTKSIPSMESSYPQINDEFTYENVPYYCLGIDGKTIYAVDIEDKNFRMKSKMEESSTINLKDSYAIIGSKDLLSKKITWHNSETFSEIANVKIDDSINTHLISQMGKIKEYLSNKNKITPLYQIDFFTMDKDLKPEKTSPTYEYLRISTSADLKMAIEDKYGVRLLHYQPEKGSSNKLYVLIEEFPKNIVSESIKKNQNSSYISCIKEYKKNKKETEDKEILKKQKKETARIKADNVLAEFAGALSATLKS